jgi:hypothetical protein
MNIELGIYEIFARTVPGAFYLLALIQLGFILKLTSFDLQIFNDLGIIPSLGLAIVAYILGSAFFPISLVWHRLFKPKNAPNIAFVEFQKRNPNWRFEFEGKDWKTLFAFIRKENPNLANAIDKQNALYIMLASISFGIIVLAMNQIVLFFLGGTYLNIIYSVFLIIGSLLIAREGRFFQSRFYQLIFETILSYQLKLENLVKRDEDKAARSSRKK